MKVLQIIDGETFGGISKLITDFDNNMKDINFDYLTSVNICDNWNNLGVSRKNLKGKIIFNHRLKKFLKENKYDIVHINTAVFLLSFQVVLICKLCGVKNIIVHSHNTTRINTLRKIMIKILNPLYRRLTSVHLTCSSLASHSLFTKTNDVILLKNGINVDEYKFNQKIRDKYRKELGIDDKLVYGHVGRFHEQKNHKFLIDLFHELQKKKDSVLVLVGIGPLENEIKKHIKELKIEDKVLLLGFREDINNLLNAFDIFIFPSLYEGLGISIIESQTNGLPTIVSSNIPEEANISKNFIQMKDFDINKWVNRINSIKIKNRTNAYKDTIKNGYDIKDVSKELEKIYKRIK